MEKIVKFERDTNNKDIIMVNITKVDEITNKEEKFVRYFDLNTKRDVEFLDELMIANGLRTKEEPKKEQTPVVAKTTEDKPKKSRKGLLIFAAGVLALSAVAFANREKIADLLTREGTPTDGGPAEVTDIVIVNEKELVVEDIQKHLNIVAAKLKEEGYEILDPKSISSALIVANIERISKETFEELQAKGYIDYVPGEILDAVRAAINPFSADNVLKVTGDQSKFISMSMFVIGDGLSSVNDRKLITELEQKNMDMFNAGKGEKAAELLLEMRDFFQYPHERTQATQGVEYLLTSFTETEIRAVAADGKLNSNEGIIEEIRVATETILIPSKLNEYCGVVVKSK